MKLSSLWGKGGAVGAGAAPNGRTGAIFFAGYLALRCTPLGAARRPQLLLVGAAAWALYAFWEWLILVRTPEANIRVDLLVIWSVLAVLSAWELFRALRWTGGTGR